MIHCQVGLCACILCSRCQDVPNPVGLLPGRGSVGQDSSVFAPYGGIFVDLHSTQEYGGFREVKTALTGNKKLENALQLLSMLGRSHHLARMQISSHQWKHCHDKKEATPSTHLLGCQMHLRLSMSPRLQVRVQPFTFPEAAVAKASVVLQRVCLFEGGQKPDLTSFLLDIEDCKSNKSLVR